MSSPVTLEALVTVEVDGVESDAELSAAEEGEATLLPGERNASGSLPLTYSPMLQAQKAITRAAATARTTRAALGRRPPFPPFAGVGAVVPAPLSPVAAVLTLRSAMS
jgi:hypothetical protein